MDYNQFTYYRAHPYANLNFMPPTAHLNRHKPQFLTQIPMGQQHLGKIGKKMFSQNAHLSNISTQNILKSPQRYPFENRIAFDKQYQRNLNTIDIEGASGGTLVSQAIRNKIKAREDIIRRQQQQNSLNKSQLQPIVNAQTFEQQKRRKVAYQQYIKDQQVKQINQNKSRIMEQSAIEQKNKNSHNYYNNGSTIASPEQSMQNQYYLKNRKSKLDDYDQLIKPRYQSIDLSRRDSSQNGYNQDRYQKGHLNERKMSESVDQGSRQNLQYIQFAQDRKSLRLQNPTNLSSQSSIHLAGKNIIKGQ